MKVASKVEAWAEVEKIFPTNYEKDILASEGAGYPIYRHRTLNPNCRICDLGNRLEVVIGQHGETSVNIWIETAKAPATKSYAYRRIVTYSERRGTDQYRLQLLAKDILKYGKITNQSRHISQIIEPNGTRTVVETGSYCIEVLNEITKTRYWVNFHGCRVTEITEEYTEVVQ